MDRVVIDASEGKILTDGEIYGRTIYLAEGQNADDFYEIPFEEYLNTLEDVPEQLSTEDENLVSGEEV